MDQSLEKLITWLRNEFILLKRDLANYIIRKIGDNTDAMNALTKSHARIADALEKQKVLPLSVTHQVNIPDIKVPEAKVTVSIPDIKMPAFPKLQIPEIKIPPIKLPTINVPKPEVTVNVPDHDDAKLMKAIAEIGKKIDAFKQFDLWAAVGVKNPLPVILVDESSKYYRAGGGESAPIVMSSSPVGMRPLNNSIFGSDRIVVAVAGTPVQLPDQSCYEVTITGLEDNTDVVVVGGANVVAANATRKGQPLEPLQSITLQIDNLNKIWIDAKANGGGATYTYLA